MLPRVLTCFTFALFCIASVSATDAHASDLSDDARPTASSSSELVDGPRPQFFRDAEASAATALHDSSSTSLFEEPERTFTSSSLAKTHIGSTLQTEPPEPFHWKGLILQSLSFEVLQNVTRIMTASQRDRRILLNKPYWSDYWASLGQFNMRRWNDGDSIKVNYIGHPMQGAISGYIQIQNDPRGRMLKISRDRAYWRSRYHAFLWTTVYSTWWELGPLGETAIFNQGGQTYPINCVKRQPQSPNYCEGPNAQYTNNTGWVDFIITPIVGTLWLIGEDTIDRYVSDRLVEHDPHAFKYKVIRSSLNPTRSLANLLRGQYPWYRDYEHPGVRESYVHQQFNKILYDEVAQHLDINLHTSTYGLQVYGTNCNNCRRVMTGAGIDVGVPIRRYIDFTTSLNVFNDASPRSSMSQGGTLTTMTFGLRTGYYKPRYAFSISLAPGFASYSRVGTDPAKLGRSTSFAAAAKLNGDYYFSKHIGVRASLVQTLIRFKSPVRDPPGIGTPPRLSFLSHEYYLNTTNWGAQVGPVFRF